MPLFLPSSPYFSSKKNLESGAAGGRRAARPLGRETREKKRGTVWKEEREREREAEERHGTGRREEKRREFVGGQVRGTAAETCCTDRRVADATSTVAVG